MGKYLPPANFLLSLPLRFSIPFNGYLKIIFCNERQVKRTDSLKNQLRAMESFSNKSVKSQVSHLLVGGEKGTDSREETGDDQKSQSKGRTEGVPGDPEDSPQIA